MLRSAPSPFGEMSMTAQPCAAANHVLSRHFDVGKAIDRLLIKLGLEGRLQAYGVRQLLPQLRGERRGERRLRLQK